MRPYGKCDQQILLIFVLRKFATEGVLSFFDHGKWELHSSSKLVLLQVKFQLCLSEAAVVVGCASFCLPLFFECGVIQVT